MVLKLAATDMWIASNKKPKQSVVHHHGPKGAEMGSPGHVECITLKKYKQSEYTTMGTKGAEIGSSQQVQCTTLKQTSSLCTSPGRRDVEIGSRGTKKD